MEPIISAEMAKAMQDDYILPDDLWRKQSGKRSKRTRGGWVGSDSSFYSFFKSDAASVVESSGAKPSWLPHDWTIIRKPRKNGARKGIIDKYYKEPTTGKVLRSKNGVMHYLKTVGEANN